MMHKICVFIPESHLEPVKAAMFAAGAGRIGNYDCCCWQVAGTGQFRPLAGSRPWLGQKEQLEVVTEYRVELVCESALVPDVIAALRTSHPYETPAFDVVRLEDQF